MLLLVGGSKDHNIARLAEAAEWRGYPYRVFYTDADPAPAVAWKPGAPDITINGETFQPDGISLFIRYDVFGKNPQEVKAAFFDAIKGWAIANPQVGLLNRQNENLEMNKPRALVLAKECGFDIPETWITRDFNSFAKKEDYIAKPVSGGAYTKLLSDMGDGSDRPYIVQKKLIYPEMRLFRIGGNFIAFEINSKVLDYRTTSEFDMKEVKPDQALIDSMRKLSDMMGLDYAAADLKTNPDTGKLEFLEINTMPMFTGYDNVANGRVSDAMFTALRNLSQPPVPAKKKDNGPVF